jgi:hypothetical protein
MTRIRCGNSAARSRYAFLTLVKNGAASRSNLSSARPASSADRACRETAGRHVEQEREIGLAIRVRPFFERVNALAGMPWPPPCRRRSHP